MLMYLPSFARPFQVIRIRVSTIIGTTLACMRGSPIHEIDDPISDFLGVHGRKATVTG